MNKDSKKLAREARAAGLVVEERSKHYMISKPGGEPVTILPHGSKTNRRLERAARVLVRRAIAELRNTAGS